MFARRILLALVAVLGLLAATPPSELPNQPRHPQAPGTLSARTPADLVILNAHIYTGATPPRVQAMAVSQGRIVALGSNQKVTPWMGPHTVVWDLPDRAIVPGLIDSHGHMSSLGEKLTTLDLTGTKSYAEIVTKCLKRSTDMPRGDWLIGQGWDQNHWAGQEMPNHQPLSSAIPDRPVALERIDGHALLVNRVALQRAGITKATPDPPGGRIERDARGEPTGVLVDNARDLVESKIPPPTQAELEHRLQLAMRACAKAGLTMVHDAGIGRNELAAYRALLARDQFPIRIYAMARATDSLSQDLVRHGRVLGDYFTLRAIEVIYDGALGSRGALLSAPYSDRPGVIGLERFYADSLARLATRARDAGLQMRVDAAGDLANKRVLDAYEQAFEKEPHPELRWAIEHCQVVHPNDVNRFARLGIVASMQPAHATSDAPWAEKRLGPKRIAWAYAWRKFLRAGARFAGGSDFPAESERPLLGIYAAMTRRDPEGKLTAKGSRSDKPMVNESHPDNLTRDEALRAFTSGGAYLAFQERDLGTLEVNKLADFVVLDPDPLDARPEALLGALVMKTVVGGKVVWDAEHP